MSTPASEPPESQYPKCPKRESVRCVRSVRSSFGQTTTSDTSASVFAREAVSESWSWPWPNPSAGPWRCQRCGFHPPTQGHRQGCPDGTRETSNAAYRAGRCKVCHVQRYRPGGTECEECYTARTVAVRATVAYIIERKKTR
jgi:hypothetical protein